jgi:hypothetical protein
MRLESAAASIDCADSKACVAFNHVDHARLEKVGLEGDARRHASQTTTVWQLIWNQRQQKLLNDKLAAEQTRILEAFLASLQAQVHQIEIDTECHWSGNTGMLPPLLEGGILTKQSSTKRPEHSTLPKLPLNAASSKLSCNKTPPRYKTTLITMNKSTRLVEISASKFRRQSLRLYLTGLRPTPPSLSPSRVLDP